MIAAPAASSFGSLLTKTKWLYDAHFNSLLKDARRRHPGAVRGPDHYPGQPRRQSKRDRLAADTRTRPTSPASSTVSRSAVWWPARPDAADRRAFRVELTAVGDGLMQQLFPIVARLNEAATMGLSASEREMLLGLLEKVMADLKSA